MLTTRAAKRDKVSVFNTDMMFDILDEGRPIGSLVFDKKAMKAAITIDGKDYTVARVSERHEEMLYQALIRVITAAEKPPPNPWALKDASGRTLALGERVKQSFAVSRGEESFSFRKVSRPETLQLYLAYESIGRIRCGLPGLSVIPAAQPDDGESGKLDPILDVRILPISGVSS